MYRTDDPLQDFLRHDYEQAQQLKRLPHCYDCGEPIQDDFVFEFDGCCYCEECLYNNHWKPVEDFIEE